MKQKIFDYVKRTAKPIAAEKKGWFERNEGLTTFWGYLTTTILSLSALLYSIYFSKTTIEISQKQLSYTLHKDSVNDNTYKHQFAHQDSLNSHQDSINRIQLNNFILQTSIQQKQFQNSKNFDKERKIEERPLLAVQDLNIDSLPKQKRFKLIFSIKNLGKRNFYLRNYYILALDTIRGISTVYSTTTNHYLIPPNFDFGIQSYFDKIWFFNNNTNYYFKIFYQDEMVETKKQKVEEYFFSIINLNPFEISIVTGNQRLKLKKEFLKLETISKNKFN